MSTSDELMVWLVGFVFAFVIYHAVRITKKVFNLKKYGKEEAKTEAKASGNNTKRTKR